MGITEKMIYQEIECLENVVQIFSITKLKYGKTWLNRMPREQCSNLIGSLIKFELNVLCDSVVIDNFLYHQ